MQTRIAKVLWAGRMGYRAGLNLQRSLVEQHRDPNLPSDYPRNTLILIEHDPVYTVGVRNKEYSEDDAKKLIDTGAEFYRTDRGGLITFHGPGQLVAYPVLDLKQFQPSIKWYVCQIEKMIIRLCAEFGIKASTSPHTGVWVNDEKICAIGIHGSRYITTHGLALNCNTDLEWFKHIVPCGIVGKGVTSLSRQLKAEISIQEIIPYMRSAFQDQFQCSLIDFPSGLGSELMRAAVKNALK